MRWPLVTVLAAMALALPGADGRGGDLLGWAMAGLAIALVISARMGVEPRRPRGRVDYG